MIRIYMISKFIVALTITEKKKKCKQVYLIKIYLPKLLEWENIIVSLAVNNLEFFNDIF